MTTTPIFRTPEDVAPELGMSKTELRRYCRDSGIHTRLSNRRIMLHQDDVAKLVEWIRERKKVANDWTKDGQEQEEDPFK